MNFVNEFRDPEATRARIRRIERVATRRWRIMEVCGGQSHSLLAHGIEAAQTVKTDVLASGERCRERVDSR